MLRQVVPSFHRVLRVTSIPPSAFLGVQYCSHRACMTTTAARTSSISLIKHSQNSFFFYRYDRGNLASRTTIAATAMTTCHLGFCKRTHTGSSSNSLPRGSSLRPGFERERNLLCVDENASTDEIRAAYVLAVENAKSSLPPPLAAIRAADLSQAMNVLLTTAAADFDRTLKSSITTKREQVHTSSVGGIGSSGATTTPTTSSAGGYAATTIVKSGMAEEVSATDLPSFVRATTLNANSVDSSSCSDDNGKSETTLSSCATPNAHLRSPEAAATQPPPSLQAHGSKQTAAEKADAARAISAMRAALRYKLKRKAEEEQEEQGEQGEQDEEPEPVWVDQIRECKEGWRLARRLLHTVDGGSHMAKEQKFHRDVAALNALIQEANLAVPHASLQLSLITPAQIMAELHYIQSDTPSQ